MFVICAAQFSNSTIIAIPNVFLFLAGASTVITISLSQILIFSLIETRTSTVMALKELLEEREYRINQLVNNLKTISDRNWTVKPKQEDTSNDVAAGEIGISMIRDTSEAVAIERLLAQGKTIVLNFVEFGTVAPEEFLELIRQYHSPGKFKLTTVDAGIFVLTPTMARYEFADVNETSEAPPKLLNEGSMPKVISSAMPSDEQKPEDYQEANDLTG
jgi:hypothetical protein